MTEENIIISLPRETVENVLDILYATEDIGPTGQGWKTNELIELIHVLEEAVGILKDNQY